MIWLRSIVLIGWLSLFTAHLAEQAVLPLFTDQIRQQASSGDPIAHLYQTETICDLFTLPSTNAFAPPVPVIKEPLFKSKLYLPERFLHPFAAFEQGFPELVMDPFRCPAVSNVLFPFHEFR